MDNELPDFMKPVPFPEVPSATPMVQSAPVVQPSAATDGEQPPLDVPDDPENDELVEIMAASMERTLTRKERKKLNQAIHRQHHVAQLEEAKRVQEEYRAASRKPVTTPEGKRQRLQDFKEMLLSPTNGTKVIRKVLEIALDDGHPGQMTALKMCLDRQLPISSFEEAKGTGGRTAIQINITGVEPAVTLSGGDVTDVEPNDE